MQKINPKKFRKSSNEKNVDRIVVLEDISAGSLDAEFHAMLFDGDDGYGEN
jgi:hypothetical protein